MSGKLDKPRHSQVRAGENGGFIVSVHKRVAPHANGSTAIQMSIDIKEVPVPERRYVADVAWVDRRADVFQFMFAQQNLKRDHLRSLVVVSVFPDAMRNLLRSFTATQNSDGSQREPFIESLHAFVKRNDIQLDPIQAFSEEPAQTVALTANLISVTFVGREAEMDFFHMAPNAIRKLDESSDLLVDPIVRIDLGTSLMTALFVRLQELGAALPPECK